jgi:hypothetical protein
MSSNIKLKRSSVPGKIPATSVIELGEIAINTHDGKIFIKKNDGAESIVTLGQTGFTGSQGIQGFTGSQGIQGFTGSQGDPGGAFINADGGDPNSNYGGIDPIDGGSV